MERKIFRKKLLILVMIISIVATDFFILGSNLITYSSELDNETNNPNVEFSAYFKNEQDERVASIQKSIKTQDLKLYAEIKVKKEGYLNEGTTIEIENSNFNIKDNITSSYIKAIKDNKVTLKQINAEKTVEIALDIEPIITEKMPVDMLSKISIIRLNGAYTATTDSGIQYAKQVCVDYQPDKATKAELETEIITNKEYSINETNQRQRIVQVLVKSRLTNNDYPVKQTILNVGIPQLGENAPEVKVLATGKLATNGATEISTDNWTVENGTLKITINNEADSKNQINWSKNVYDEAIVTYIYTETANENIETTANTLEITTNSVIKVHNTENTYTATQTKSITNQELSNVIIGKTEITTEEMYKGKIKSNIDQEYNTKTSIIVPNANIVDERVVKEGKDAFGTDNGELEANTKYITTELNLEKTLNILGEDGSLQIVPIKNGEKIVEKATEINKGTVVNENGNVIITYEDLVDEIEIITTKPTTIGIIELNHTKVITGNNYTKAQLQEVKTLKAKNSIIASIEKQNEETGETQKQNIVERTTETSIELKETITKAEMTIDKTILSTTAENEVNIGIELTTADLNYDLFKNPTFKIQLPSAVEKIEFIGESSILNGDGFTAISQNYDETNNIVTVNLTGAQTAYPETEIAQTYIQVSMKITLKELATSEGDKITMTYTNELANVYVGGTTDAGIVEQTIEISAQPGLWKTFNISSSDNTSETETLTQQITDKLIGKTVTFETRLVNNVGSNMSNVRILGKLPTTGNTITGQNENTLETTLKNVEAENATIYYTENVNATIDTENTENGWTTELTSLINAKMYLIKLEQLAQGSNYAAKVNVQLPSAIEEELESYTQYEVIYDTDTKTEVKETSRKISLVKYIIKDLDISVIGTVGRDRLSDGDKVKEGEIIKYTVTVKNNGTEGLENLQLNLDVPQGTVYVKPVTTRVSEDGTHVEVGEDVYIEGCYQEITDSQQLAELTEMAILKLTAGQAYTAQYEVRVNKGVAGSNITNQPTVVCNEETIEGKTSKYIIEDSNLRVSITRTLDESIPIYPDTESRYAIYIENLSNSTIKDLELQILHDGFIIFDENNNQEQTGKIQISELPPKDENGVVSIGIYGIIERVEEMNISAIVKDSEGKQYRSNLLSAKVPHMDASISMTSPQNGAYLQEGDLVEYNIIVKNTGQIKSSLSIKDDIPTYLQVQAIYLNQKLDMQTTEEEEISNIINYGLYLEPQEQVKVDIIAKVGYIDEIYHGITINNIAILDGINVSKNSRAVTHILQANSKQEDDIENIISGFAWLDSKTNGERDASERTLSGVKVKLYNTIEKHYVSDENGNIIEKETNDNGEYNFTKVSDGSYLIVFEYDMEHYEPTTYMAENTDTSINSKAIVKSIDTNQGKKSVGAIELNNLKENVFFANIGLKEGKTESPIQPEDNEEKPGDTEEPGDIETPGENTEEVELKTINGIAWLDVNRNGQKDTNENTLEGIRVKVYDIETKAYLETTTDKNGKYKFGNIEKGKYILIFEYDTDEYEPTTYLAQGVHTSQNSKVVLKKIKINGQEILAAVTDTIKVENNVNYINIGLIENLKFDLELDKYISRIIVQTSKETKAYDYKEEIFAKTEIHKKQINGALVVLEYTIKVRNNGEISGYVRNIVDYIPKGLTFSSELNSDWYLSGDNLYTKSLENIKLNPGEEKEIKLLLTKRMTNENLGLINNRAEIYQDYNKYGEVDIDSIPNNQQTNEDDFGTVDVIIQVATGGNNIAFIILIMLNMILIGIVIKIITKKKRR